MPHAFSCLPGYNVKYPKLLFLANIFVITVTLCQNIGVPRFKMNPPNKAVEIGGSVKFIVEEIGGSVKFIVEETGGLEKSWTYEWKHNGKAMNDKITKELEIRDVKKLDKGKYECVVKIEGRYSEQVCAELSKLTCIYY